MEVRHEMKIVICPNDKCKVPIRLSEGKFVGGVNDKGGIIIECENCKTIFPCRLKNAKDASGVIKNGRLLEAWIDEMPTIFESEYGITADAIDKVHTSIVFGYEKPSKVCWEPSLLPLFQSNGINHEVIAKEQLIKNQEVITGNFKAYFNLYVKGRHSAEKSFVILNYNFNGKEFKAVFAKQVDSERDLNIDNLYLIYHTEINLEYEVDGIYERDQLLVFLERFLNRWRYAANEVLLVVPFIGFNYKNSEEALYELWNWLEINVDTSKTNLITRKGTFNLFKRAQDNSGIPFEELVTLGLLEPLVEKMNQRDTEYFQKSHAKYYVGVYNSYVEVLSGSFNIHKGKYFENIVFKRYDKNFFKRRYLHMFKEFEYLNNDNDEQVHYMTLGTSDDKNYIIGLKELLVSFQ